MLFSLTLFFSVAYLSFSNVHAAEFVIEDGNESPGCASIGGTWYEKDFVCYTNDVTLDKDDSLTIDSNYIVVFAGTFENNGKILVSNSDGGVLFGGVFNNNEGASFETFGRTDNDVIISGHPEFEIEIGTINNYGTMDNFGGFTVDGNYDRISSSTPDDFVVLENYGVFRNHAFMGFNPGTIVNNHGSLENKEQLSFSTFNNNEGATMTNLAEGSFFVGNALNNEGMINNLGVFEDRFCSVIINDSGTISGNSLADEACLEANKDMKNSDDQISNTTGGGCLIATAAYGTEMAPQVQFLREIRDNTVLSTFAGASFMTGFNQLYYSFSPTIANMEREHPLFQEVIHIVIAPMISTLHLMTLADVGNEFEVITLGISVIALNLGMYIVAPIATILVISKHLKSKSESIHKKIQYAH